ncbi:flagellar hook-basal body complex protein FliE [Shouchella shacheensis]|uniref:flagellar hook-basal body complex protein FliE n=1 Tax=Shouchella shacheensis TaxID=1649580 RepID=UPI00073FFDF2|nr:flagellar hook-basal body complex protein FliE [Shouchella shacheensis]
MERLSIQPFTQPMVQPQMQNTAQAKSGQTSFQEVLSGALQSLNEAQNESSEATKALATKESTDIHEVMITASKASLSLQTALEVRNKAVEAYQEMMRMQV